MFHIFQRRLQALCCVLLVVCVFAGPSPAQTNSEYAVRQRTINLPNIVFTASSGGTGNGSLTAPFNSTSDLGTVMCGSGLGVAMKGHEVTGSLDLADSACKRLFNLGHSYYANNIWRAANDTAQLMLESCPFYHLAYFGFDWMQGSLEHMGDSGAKRALFLDFLKKELYANTVDPNWFCAAALTIAGELPIDPGSDTIRQYGNIQGTNQYLSVLYWMLHNTSCNDETNEYWGNYLSTRRNQYNVWKTDSMAGLHYDLDTTLPPLSKWGLDTLFAHYKRAGVRLVNGMPVSVLSDLRLSSNPTHGSTSLTFTLSEDHAVSVEILDLLGGRVRAIEAERVLIPDEHGIPLDLNGLPSGSYYVRIEVNTGEAQTLKLILE